MRTFTKLIVVAALVLSGLNSSADGAVLTDAEILQLERKGGIWADATTVHGYGIADRLKYMGTDGSYSGPSSYRITVIGGAGDKIGFLISQEDGTNEIGYISLELDVTLTD